MMKLTKILWTAGLFATMSFVSPAVGKEVSILGSYKSGGYTLDLGSNGDYYTCNPQNRCLSISHTKSSQQGNTRIWRQDGSTYRVTPIGKALKRGKYTRISVKKIDLKNKPIFDRIFRSQ